MFSTSSKDIVINTLHCRIPLINIPIGTWLNLSIDVLSFVSECFKSQTFRSIDYISITANCKIRRIFSMRNSLTEWNKTNNEEFPMEYGEILPKSLALPMGVPHENINLNIDKLRQYLFEADGGTQSGHFSQGQGYSGMGMIQAAQKNSKEGVNATYNTNNEGIYNNNNNNQNSHSSPFVNRNNTNKIEHQIPTQTPLIVAGTNNGHKKSNMNQRIARNSASPNKIIHEIRSKSQNRPIKNVNTNYNMNIYNDGHELMNKQEYIKNDLRFLSKSPENQTDEENSVNMDLNLKNKQGKYKTNHMMKVEMIKNNFKNMINNKNNMMNLKKPIKLNQNLLSAKNQHQLKNKAHKIINPVDKSKIPSNDFINLNLNTEEKDSNLMLLNTLNYKNIEKWEVSKDNMADSIEEIFEIEEKKNVNNWENNNLNNNINVPNRINTHSQEKNRTEDSEDKFYYDIPIKDNKKKTHSNYKDSSNFFNSNTKFNKYKESSSVLGDNLNTLDTKRQIISEILKESQNTLTMIDRERPFTPPFTKLVPIFSMQSLDKENVILERAKEETLNSDIHSIEINTNKNKSFNEIESDLKKVNSNGIKVHTKDSFNLNKSNNLKTGEIKTHHDLDLIYDHVLGCYYDTKTNMYYELKNNY